MEVRELCIKILDENSGGNFSGNIGGNCIGNFGANRNIVAQKESANLLTAMAELLSSYFSF